MTATTCTRCGASLPAVAADQRHPDWCATCAARASGQLPPAPLAPPPGPTGAGTWGGGPPAPGAPGAPPAPPGVGIGPPRLVVKTRLAEGVLVGVASAALAGALWWGVTATIERTFVYGAILVGVLVGQGVLLGARRGGPLPAVVAGTATLVALVVAEYFIQRSLAIDQLGVELPLWQGFSMAREVVSTTVEDDPVTGLFWLVAAVAAVVTTASPERRPVL